MKRLLLTLAALVFSSPFIHASPCAVASLASYLALGPTGCTIDGHTLSNFQTLPGTATASPISAADVALSPFGGSTDPGLSISTTLTALANAPLELVFTYQISGASYSASSIALSNSSETGDGAVTGIQNFCAGGAFGPDGVSGCTGLPGSLLTLDGIQQSDQSPFAPTPFLNVTNDFELDGGLAGSATGGTFTNQFTAASAVPEPATWLLAAFGILLIVFKKVSMNRVNGKKLKSILSVAVVLVLATPPTGFAASHREAPITALDHKADITDFFAFVSYDDPSKVTFLLNVDPLLEPGNGPNYFPFDDNILYAIRIDNNNDAKEDISFQVQFQTAIRAPAVFTGFVGAGNGINAPANSPAPIAPGTAIIPPAITALDGAGAAGLSLRQTYTVTMVKNGVSTPLVPQGGASLIAVPSNVGPRTMPNYPALAAQGIYHFANGIKVFAGTVDDPFYIDLGAAFDSLNFRTAAGGGALSAGQDADDHTNTAPDFVSGYNVNTIAIEVPIALLTSTGSQVASTNPAATIGAWGTTSRPRIFVRRSPLTSVGSGGFAQVQRMGNPLINELIIGTGSKDYWSMSAPVDDSQFANFDLDPLLARALNAIYGFKIPTPPRTDLLPLVTYAAPIAAPGTPAGPIADLLRLNTGVPPTSAANRRRLGLIAGDAAGFPNGRRVSDDVTDIAARAVAGILAPGFNVFPNNVIGDGVNTNDVPYQETFPYVAWAQSGRGRRHIDPGESGCTMGAGAPCPVN